MDRVELLGMQFARVKRSDLLAHVAQALGGRQGGWIVTANLDILLSFLRSARARATYESADLVVADGMPLVWASRLKGEPIPERIAGSDLIEPMVALAAERRWRVFLLGGASQSAEVAAEKLRSRHSELQIEATSEVRFSSPPEPGELDVARRALVSGYDVVFVGLGSPKQEFVIEALRADFPRTWMVGVGGSFSFLSGQRRRAPAWLARSGFEWAHRMWQEPGRLGRRYLIHDLPLFCRLMVTAAFAGRRPGSPVRSGRAAERDTRQD